MMKKARIIIFVLSLSIIGFAILVPGRVQANQSPASTPVATPTLIPTPDALTSQPKDEVTYKDLVEHYAAVTDLVLKIIGTVVTLLGAFGIVAGYVSLKTIRDLQKLVDDVTKKVKEVEDSLTRVNDVRDFSLKATNRVQYILEIKSKNADVRTRAAQQLSESNDILAVEILAELLKNDDNENVKMESAYGLGKLLALGGSEVETASIGISALVDGLQDSSESVKTEAVDALDTLVCNNVVLPRYVIRKLSDLNSTAPKLNQKILTLLEHIKKQQENKIK
jgi:HEAT repeat protein